MEVTSPIVICDPCAGVTDPSVDLVYGSIASQSILFFNIYPVVMAAHEVPLVLNPITPTALTWTRDKDYYFKDGSLKIFAEGRLFKIHRTLFERDSPSFGSLLSLPLGEGQECHESHSDDRPIVCPDSADDFRALCWVVYSRPADVLAQQQWVGINFPRLIRVAAISHKYNFTAYRDWALNALQVQCDTYPSPFLDRCHTWSEVSTLLKLATECGRKAFGDRLQQTLLDQISSSSDRTAAFKKALDVAEGSDLPREFHAQCYYLYLQSSGVFETPTQGVIPIDLVQIGSYMGESLAGLGSERSMRLLTGFWSLSQLRNRLTQPPKLVDNPSCRQHTRDCVNRWEQWWKKVLQEAMGFRDPGKLIGNITERAREILGPHFFNHTATIPCKELMRPTIESLKADFDTSLAKRFMIA